MQTKYILERISWLSILILMKGAWNVRNNSET